MQTNFNQLVEANGFNLVLSVFSEEQLLKDPIKMFCHVPLLARGGRRG